MKKILHSFLAILLTLLCSTTYAQTISGKVLDDAGAVLVGATVMERGSTNGTRTNGSGQFILTLKNGGKTVDISYVGMSTKSINDADGDLGKIILNTASRALNDIVVVGYGSTKKNDLTASVGSVKAKDFQQGIVLTADQLILGKVPGVQITQNSGEPGVGARIRIRGGASLTASNDPLIVIDGMILDANEKVLGSANPLNLINPNDIETFDILKDAAATAIYGNRGSNGVIIITTKKGSKKSERVNFTYTTNNSLSTLTNRKIDNLSASEFRDLISLKFDTTVQSLMGNDSTNWYDQVIRNAFTTDNNLAMTGGLKGLPYRLSIGNMRQNGIIKRSALDRYSVGLNLSPTFLNNSLKVNLNTKYAYTTDQYVDIGGTIGSALSFDPTQSIYSSSPDGLFGGYTEWLDNASNPNGNAPRNPLGILNQRDNNRKVGRFIGNVQLDYRLPFFKNLRFNLNAGLDNVNSNALLTIPEYAASNFSLTNPGLFKQESEKRNSTLIEFYTNYNKSFRKHNFDAFVGASEQDNIQLTPSYNEYGKNGIKRNANPFPFKTRNTQVSYFGRANYNFANKYYLAFSLRNDYSSRFDKSVRSGLFPSVSAAWRINNEEFLKNNKKVSNLKLRAGWGQTGQQNVGLGDYYYFAKYNLSNNNAQYQFGNQFYSMYRADPNNPFLKWEVVTSQNVGLDMGFFKNRINATVDVYNRKTTDLLAEVFVPALTAASNKLLRNIGSVRNRGIETNLNIIPIATRNITWEVNMNYTYNVNKILSLTGYNSSDSVFSIPTGDVEGIGSQKIQLYKSGYSINTFHLYQQVYDEKGSPIEGVFVDQNKDGKVNELDLVANHSSEPRHLFGISSSIAFKKINVGFIARAQDGYMYNNIASNYGSLASAYNSGVLNNLHGSYYDTRFKTRQILSDYYLENAAFFRLDNVNVGYNFGNLSKNNSSSNLRATAAVQNVFVITNYTGADPEIPGGIDKNVYPRPRVYSLGLQLEF
jgi:TonB-dependent starch-binding outer membrane protein SusC